ncbi:MAG TPA: hypothetical protein VGQ37_02390 [Vicinamibacterales bacterium]|nr:hypothetical protein [Vicinamibacterales bacterium]HEV8616215.1 hypothetical protein [Methylomirabilota bacterium]
MTAILGLVFAGFLAAFVVGISPHLVHHLFDDDHEQADCPFASVAERQQGVTPSIAVTLAPAHAAASPLLPAPAAPPSSGLAPSSPRAPPTLAA